MAKKKETTSDPKAPTLKSATAVIRPIVTATNKLPPIPIVQNAQDVESVSTYAVAAKDLLNKLDERKEKYIKPLRQYLDMLYAEFREPKKPLEAYHKQCKAALNKYYTDQEQKARVQAEKQAALMRESDPDMADAMVDQLSFDFYDKSEKPSVIKVRHVWKFKIVDTLKVPREYLMIDEAKLKKYAKLGKDAPQIPGVEFFEEVETAI